MLRPRLIAMLCLKGNRVVQSIRFRQFLPVGAPEVCVENLNRWGIDEIILCDIDASRTSASICPEIVEKVSSKCFVPLAAGGGIKTPDQMSELIHHGADKIILNTQALLNPALISEGAKMLGDQCMVVSVNVFKSEDGKYRILNTSDNRPADVSLDQWLEQIQDLGAGEVFINTVHCDGVKEGFDLDLLRSTLTKVKIPLIFAGGAGHPEHFKACYEAGAPAVAAGNYFQFTEHSPITTKSFLIQSGIKMRMDTFAQYRDASFHESGRIAKMSEQYLKELRYQKIIEEKI